MAPLTRARAIKVVAGVIEDAGNVWVCCRPAHKAYGNCWEFPGGKVESGETDEQALVRELSEEVAVHVRGTTYIMDTQTGSHFLVRVLRVVDWQGVPVAKEGQPVVCKMSLEELAKLPMTPATQAACAHLQNQ